MSGSLHLITGASGQLGRKVVDALLRRMPAERIAVLVRDAGAGAAFAERGVAVRVGDYERVETLDAAMVGVGAVLLISSNALGRRALQHRNTIEAARRADVSLLAYTSLLHADTTPLGLAEEHRATEADIRASGIPFALLRNGWYTENYTAGIPAALAHGAVIGCAREGRISSASRDDYAEAAAAVLAGGAGPAGRTYELAGDDSYTLSDFAAAIAKSSGQAVAYANLSEADHEAALRGAGLPESLAHLLADSDAGAARGALFDDGRQLSALIGRPTTPMAATVAREVAGLRAAPAA